MQFDKKTLNFKANYKEQVIMSRRRRSCCCCCNTIPGDKDEHYYSTAFKHQEYKIEKQFLVACSSSESFKFLVPWSRNVLEIRQRGTRNNVASRHSDKDTFRNEPFCSVSMPIIAAN